MCLGYSSKSIETIITYILMTIIRKNTIFGKTIMRENKVTLLYSQLQLTPTTTPQTGGLWDLFSTLLVMQIPLYNVRQTFCWHILVTFLCVLLKYLPMFLRSLFKLSQTKLHQFESNKSRRVVISISTFILQHKNALRYFSYIFFSTFIFQQKTHSIFDTKN